MAAKRLAVFDPSGRLIADLEPLADQARVLLVAATLDDVPPNCAAMLVPPLVAGDLGPPPADGPPRWIVGDGSNAGRVAGAAAQAGAQGVLLTPVSVEAIANVAHADSTSADIDLARARALIATSLVNLTGAAQETLLAVAEGFSAHDCIVWWRDGGQMVPTAARPSPNESYRTQVAGAARIAAAAAGTVMTAGPLPRSVIADALRSSPTEVAGLVAIVSDSGRRFTQGERADLKAIAARLTRELSWLSSHRRLVAEGERLLAASLHDPLTGAMARGAFEQTIAHEVAAAGRRKERLTLSVIDVVGLRKINLQYRHTSGDEVLAQVASRIRATVRGNDPIGRLGGDEIAVLLVGATDDQAALVVRKLIHKVQSEPIKIDGSTEISVQVRAVASELAIGERSGESAVARCYAALRTAPIGDVLIVASDDRTGNDDAGNDTGSLSAGTVVGGTYRVVHELSRGAMGVVYRGEDLGLGRAVAIKVLRSDLASDRDLVSRFRAEAGILASLHHPNLVQVYALGEHNGDVYFVMELVEGQPLSEVLRATLERKEWFPTAAVAQITMEIADALDSMHTLGLIHRDVKPANILLDRERDRAVLVDVGVAVKAGDQRDAAGTPGFAAPESFLEPTDAPTTDVYGLAATAYCMLTGRPPFGSGPAPSVVQRQISDPLTPPSQLRFTLSEAVDAVIAKGLQPVAKKRWTSATTFAIALGRALERLPADEIPEAELQAETPDPVKAAEAVLRVTAGFGNAPLPSLPSQRIVVGQVRAAHLRVLSRLLQHHLGEGGMAKMVNETPQLAQALAPTLAPLAWIDLADLVNALDRARERVPSQLVARKVGRGTMSATFPRLFGADPASLPAETVLTALPTCWNRFHDWGDITVDVEPNQASVVMGGYAGSVEVCTLVEASLERIIELTGAHEVNAIHTLCACTGDARCEFRLSWSSQLA
ncbi:MAG: diguanylate cyclase [Myxococcota bacterium]|nr:diguanylate cyclase [Myxococcota bacterium]